MGMKIITRQEAISTGESYYFTGKPCKRGHYAKRHVTGCGCVDCIREFSQQPEARGRLALYRKRPEVKEKSRIHAKEFHRSNRESCLEKMKARNRVYYAKNRERIKAQAITYQKENAPERTKYKREWAKKKAQIDPAFKMGLVCRRMLHRVLGVAGQKKYKNTHDYFPYSYSQLVESLESQFTPGMSWSNYGEWHIDHKKSVSSLPKEGITDPVIINGLENLQPLWASENMAKGSR